MVVTVGAFDLRVHHIENAARVTLVSAGSGWTATYEMQLVWIPDATAAIVRSGSLRLGEDCEASSNGVSTGEWLPMSRRR